MKDVHSLSVLLIVVMLFVGCGASVAHQKSLFTGETYKDLETEEDAFLVSFWGDRELTRKEIENRILIRAAKITLNRGYDYFIVGYFLIGKDAASDKAKRLNVKDSSRLRDPSASMSIQIFKGKTNREKPNIYIAKELLNSTVDLETRSPVFYSGGAVMFLEPKPGGTVSAPVRFCMQTEGLKVEPATNGVREGYGHHHLLIDVGLPTDLTKPFGWKVFVGKDEQYIHLINGETCTELNLKPGKHIVRSLFAKGNHVPYNPPITSTVIFTVASN